jgi:hypothetical protein
MMHVPTPLIGGRLLQFAFRNHYHREARWNDALRVARVAATTRVRIGVVAPSLVLGAADRADGISLVRKFDDIVLTHFQPLWCSG